MSQKESLQRIVTGKVTSNKMDKAVTVSIERKIKHPLYGKYIKRTSKIHAQDIDNSCQIGDIVSLRECRPVSKTISWQVVEVVERAEG
ncbi:MAG: 30S ribosomal protein S17 [Gammaproteobacteria bacterium]|nr:MAG: 30S ribosomal protein S17 [Gammaproteobacteria bacterium]